MEKTSQYVMCPIDSSDDDKLGRLKEFSEDGLNFLKNQRSWKDIDLGVSLISGESYKSLKGMSDINVPMVKRDTRESVATLANMRPLWGYKTDNNDLQKQSIVLNKMLRAWYYQPFVRKSIRGALQYAAGCGLGWIGPGWMKDGIIAGRGDIGLEVYGPRDVRPYGIGRDNNIQKAYLVDIVKEMPLQQAMALFPTRLDVIVPSRGIPTWMTRGIKRVNKFVSPILRQFGQGAGTEKEDTSPFPTVDIHHTYVLDMTINQTGEDIWMGEIGTNWQYKVPSYNSDIDTGMRDEKGNALIRKAGFEDSMLYPLRRRVIWTEQGIISDGSSPWWHGKVPAIPFVTDDWPWDFLGYPMARDGASIERSATRLLRAIDDSANVKLDMPLAWDETAVSQGLTERFNPRKPGQRIKINMPQNEQPIKPIIPAEYYNIDAVVAGMPEKLYELMHHILGTRDVQALAKAKQVPSGDSVEKLMELSGPILTDMSNNMEGSMVELGEQWKGLAFQWYDMRRRVQVLGKDETTEEDYDYDPGNMIPSHLPDEFEKIKKNAELAKRGSVSYEPPASRASIVDRARAHLNSFYFHITPSSLHQITQLTKKMMAMNLFKIGFPIDPWTVAEAMDLENFGSPASLAKILDTPKEKIPDDIMGRWIMFKELMAKMAPQQGQPGRKGSGQTPPTMQSKDGGHRQTMRESPR